ncbi:SGNH hydrolase [Xylariomycetidae sp. FL2044]|nr:SGNH hydrolase [Xylariomycetidae sp. FL2044]
MSFNMSLFAKTFALLLLPTTLGSPLNKISSIFNLGSNKRDNDFVWASVGDSWASGVSYSADQDTDYDDDKYGCHRWKDSYGPLMERNTSWVKGLQEFHFAACSGATLDKIVINSQGENPAQMSSVGNPQMITYHAGGNNCGFGAVVTDCVYQPTGDFGPEYPNPDGQCAKRLKASNEYINSDNTGRGNGLYIDELNTVRDILNHPAVKDNQEFRLYILGYAQFFHTGDNYCNEISFGALAWLPWGNKPKLTNRLRTDINDGVRRVNEVLGRVAKDVGDARVKFLDVNPSFDTHRFCEDHHNYQDQWYSRDVWLWNLNLPRNDPPADPSGIDAWLSGGRLPDGTNVTEYPSGTVIGDEMQGGVVSDDFNASSGSGSGGGSPTWQQRPFHPKHGGTHAIANIVMAQAMADKIPGVLGSEAPETGTCDCNESGCSVNSPACCANGTC